MPTTTSVATQLYSSFVNAIGGNSVNLSTDHLYVALVNSSYTPNQSTDTYWSTPQAHEVSGFGYTAGGVQLTGTSWTGSVYSCASFSWSSLTVSNLRYLVIYDKSTGSGPSSYRLVGYIDLGSAQNLVGQPLSVTLPGGVLLTLFSGIVVPSVVSANITDATTLGRQLITAADAPTARSALGVAGVPGAGMVKSTGSALTPAVSGTDYAPATSGSSILKASGGGFANAVSGTDYAPATTGSSLLKGNGSGGFSTASSTSDYVPWSGGTGGLLPATSGQKLTTQGGNTLDDGSGNVVIKGGTLDGVTIGATTPAVAVTAGALNSPSTATAAITSGTAQGVWLNQSQLITGTNSSTSGCANFLSVADEVNNSSTATFDILQVVDFVASPAKGGRTAINGQVSVAGVGAGGGAGYIGLGGRATTSVNLGGTSTQGVGQFWGAWLTCAINGGTYHYSATGLEVDVNCMSNSIQQKKGIRIVLGTGDVANDTVRGTLDDTALQVIQNSGAMGWGIGIKFGTDQSSTPATVSGYWPFTNTSTIIGTSAVGNGLPANIGIDFSNITFSDCAIKTGPAPIQMGAMASAPATPASGKGKFYIASDGSLHYLGASGTDTRLAVA